MKSKTNQITLVYVIISMLLAVICYIYFPNYKNNSDYQNYIITKDIIFIILSGIILKYLLFKNNIKNTAVYAKITRKNEEINETNNRYNIVSKATSDTIWDWKILEDKMIWSKGIESVFGYKQEEIGEGSKWWFDNIHPEDSIKMSIKLYSFIEQKTEKWQDQYRFKCADGSYKYVLDRGFTLKDEEGKSVRMIGAIQDITKQKEEEQRLKLL